MEKVVARNSKKKLVGVLLATTFKKLHEQLGKLCAQEAISLAELNTDLPTTTTDAQMESFDITHPAINRHSALQLSNNNWYLLSTKTTGNKRFDKDLAVAGISTIRQRSTRSIADFAQRVTTSVDNYRLLNIDILSEETKATRLLQGLDHARYSSLPTYLINEPDKRRDINPTDIGLLKKPEGKQKREKMRENLLERPTTKSKIYQAGASTVRNQTTIYLYASNL